MRDDTRARLSQNFLRSPRAVDLMLTAADGPRADLVVEIGAGDGSLTRELAAGWPRVRAYEIDRSLRPRLHRRLTGLRNVDVRWTDALDAEPPEEPFDVVANIPYGATAAIVRWCLAAPGLRTATLLTQLDYARRRTGRSGRWSRLTVLTWPDVVWRLAGRVDRSSFRPVPAVDGGVLVLTRRPAPLVPPAARRSWEAAVHLGYSGVGGTLAASLARRWPREIVRAACAEAGVHRSALVATVPPERWLVLHRALTVR